MENTQKAKTLRAQAIIDDIDKLEQEINKFSNKRLYESENRRLETIKIERKELRKEAAILELKDGAVFGSLYNGHQKFRDMINESNNSDEIIDDIMQLIKIHGEGRLINEIIAAADLPEIE
jgi:hypothetical protein